MSDSIDFYAACTESLKHNINHGVWINAIQPIEEIKQKITQMLSKSLFYPKTSYRITRIKSPIECDLISPDRDIESLHRMAKFIDRFEDLGVALLRRFDGDVLKAKAVAHLNQLFLDNITDSLPQYVYWKDTESVYLGCNKNFATLVGLSSPKEIINKTDHDLNWQTGGDSADTFRQGDLNTISGQSITNHEETLALPNGKCLTTIVSKLPILDGNKVIGIVGCFTDITKMKEKEQELIEAKKQAEISHQVKDAFIQNISHDIRTPLTGIVCGAEHLSAVLKEGIDKQIANNLLASCNSLLKLLNEVIELTKFQSGNMPVYENRFELKAILDDIVNLFTPAIEQKGINLSVGYDDAIAQCLLGDKIRVHRILLSLISNAVKFTDKGSIRINVTLAKQAERKFIIQFIIEDTGIGIPEEKQDIIFTRFQRLDPAYNGKYKGIGLGLFLVKQFVADLKGEIYVKSEIDKGAKFTCLLPFKKPLLDKLNI